ncbi:hypothetical protein WQE_15511 [Paraburkholderia hospita]|uniref:Uncharacterized protein n=1 Tax=Paraburkholderia hospita TaxID=169430 RepID=A0ABN0FP12_9BURK|nr:hypothetical protein [Paraburkholderia hospita]EIN00451.1 hypothetical protein WQE_15511 [Paraburkholderia hospita]OUL88457.1 hypothetical protein CA602_11430 [Paraburkholderia hospita]
MSNYFDPDWTPQVSLPLKRVGDRWEFLYGGDVPVADGAIAELRLSVSQITDEQFKQRVTQETIFEILPEGSELWVALSDRNAPAAARQSWPQMQLADVPAGATRFEKIRLGPRKKKAAQSELFGMPEKGGLWLKLKGLESVELVSSTVHMPEGFSAPTATSLNHAFTLLSQAYETHRISNTGNVYARVFYLDRDGICYPLDDLRKGVQVGQERELIHQLWADVEQKLGWRPTPQLQKTNKKKR